MSSEIEVNVTSEPRAGMDAESVEKKLQMPILGEPNFRIASCPRVLVVFSMTFPVRMAQDLKRFEQGRL